MSSDNRLEPVQHSGGFNGFVNLLCKENADLWSTSTWMWRTLVAVGVLNGLVGATIFMSQAGLGGVEISGDPLKDSVMLFAQLVSALISIGVVLVVQGAIIDELESGTAEWVLSKPVSRAAYILSKFVSSTVGTFATMLVIPAFVLYFEVGLLLGEYLDPWRFAQGMFALAPLFVFLTGLSLMIGTFSRSRAVVAGVPIALLLGQQLLLQVAPWLSAVLPYSLPVPAGELVFGETLTMVTPLAAVPLLGVLFTAVGVWRFSTIDL